MSDVDELRRAASVLREKAGPAALGPWNAEGYGDWVIKTGDGRNLTAGADFWQADAECVALMHPPVALALADWLDDEAARGLGRPDNVAAYAVARAVLREAGE